MLYDAKVAQAMATRLFELGVYVSGFFFPVVPKGRARIRTQMNAALSRETLDTALEMFEHAGRDTGVLK
jgi:glycine C-acetyltransferase